MPWTRAYLEEIDLELSMRSKLYRAYGGVGGATVASCFSEMPDVTTDQQHEYAAGLNYEGSDGVGVRLGSSWHERFEKKSESGRRR